MNKIVFLLLLLINLLVGCSSMDNKKEKERLDQKEKELNNREKMLEHSLSILDTSTKTISENNEFKLPKKKYLYVKILTLEPSTEIDSYTGKSNTKWESHVHTSNISEVEDLTDDLKAKIMDGFAISVRAKMKWVINSEGQSTGRITDRKCVVFDNYSNASDDKFKNGNKF